MNGVRIETFKIDRAGFLCRDVSPRHGKDYMHRCSLRAFREVAHHIDERAKDGFTLETMQDAIPEPMTQIAVALAFMKERGVVITEGRVNYAACPKAAFEDAMIEYHALDENGPD